MGMHIAHMCDVRYARTTVNTFGRKLTMEKIAGVSDSIEFVEKQ